MQQDNSIIAYRLLTEYNPRMDISHIKEQRSNIIAIMDKHGADNVRLFGSFNNGTAAADSDVDFLVSLRKGTTLFDLGAMYMDLRDLLGREVDIVSDTAISKHIRKEVITTATPL